MPALPPHGDRHFSLDYVIGAHVKEGYIGSTDLLTRVAQASNFATDTCIRQAGVDPKTGARYLEELAFEVVNEQSLQDITEQAEDLSARGVRRLIAIFVKKGDVCEWSAQAKTWKKLELDGMLSDRVLSRPLRVRALLDAAEADNAVARALLAKDNPILMEARNQSLAEGEKRGLAEGEKRGLAEGEKKGLAEGEKKGLRQGIESLCEVLQIELTSERRARMSELDVSGLESLLARIRADRRFP